MTEYETLLVERCNGVVSVTLNRPERRNAMNPTMWREMLHAFTAIEENASDRVLVLSGAGLAFCAGADLTALDPDEQMLTGMRRIGSAALSLHHMSKPTIAKVAGPAVGGGCNLALGCDIVVASEEATFHQLFTPLGLSPDFGGTWLLPRLVGISRAKQLMFLGSAVGAQEALVLGLVAEVVAGDQLDKTVDEMATRLASTSAMALANVKRLLNQSGSLSYADAVEAEAHAQVANVASSEFKAAVRTFRARGADIRPDPKSGDA